MLRIDEDDSDSREFVYPRRSLFVVAAAAFWLGPAEVG